MTAQTNNFEGQTAGGNATNANSATSGFALGFNRGTGSTTVYNNTHPAHGSIGLTMTSGSAAACSANVTLGTSTPSAAMQRAIYVAALPTSAGRVMLMKLGSCAVYLDSSGRLVTFNAAGAIVNTSTGTLVVGSTYRVELVVVTNASTTAGTIKSKACPIDSDTAVTGTSYSATNVNAGTTNVTTVFFANASGDQGAQSFTDYMDDIAYDVGVTDYLGAAVFLPGNVAPTANAGVDQTVTASSSVNLNGTASSDPDGTIVSYSWAQMSGTTVTLTGATTSTPSFTAPSGATVLAFRLTVTDNLGATGTDDVTITVSSNVPTVVKNGFEGQTNGVSATPTNSANSGFSLAFNRGTGSTTVYSNAHPGHGSIGIVMHSGSAAACSGNVTVTATATGAAQRAIYVAALPTAAGRVLLLKVGACGVYLNSSGQLVTTNGAGTIVNTSTGTLSIGSTYRIDLVVIPNASTTAGTIKSKACPLDSDTPVTGTEYTTTTGNAGTTSWTGVFFGNADGAALGAQTFDDYMDDLAYSVDAIDYLGAAPYLTTNQAPYADAGPDQTVEPYATVTLTSAASVDSDGTIASRTWTQLSGTTVTLSSTTATSPTFTAPASITGATLVFQISVTDNLGATGTDQVTITVLPHTIFQVTALGLVPVQMTQL